MNQSEERLKTHLKSSWGATLAAILPIVGFWAAFTMAGTIRELLEAAHLDPIYRFLWMDALRISVMPLIFYLVLLGGLLVAWLNDFPRWSYPYLGFLLIFLVSGVGISGLEDPYLWLIWGPIIITILPMVLLRPSIQPLRSLFESWRKDWTLSLLGISGILEFLIIGSFDEMPGPRESWRFVCMVVLVVGIIGYLRASSRAIQAAALLGGSMLSLALGMIVMGYYWQASGFSQSGSAIGWVFWVVVLAVPAVLSMALKFLFNPYPK